MIDTIDSSYYTSPMAMGKRKRDRQPTMWVTTTDLPTAASHPFYRRLNQLLREHRFDEFVEAQKLEAVAAVTDDAVAVIEEVVADKGYHSRTTVHDLETLEIRTYISEPHRGLQSWTDQAAERDAVYANRRRIRGDRGKRLLRRRGELLERPCAHLYETGGLRRAHVRGHENVLKRLLVHAGAFNLGLWMRTLCGVGTPRNLQGRLAALGVLPSALWTIIDDAMTATWSHRRDHPRSERPILWCVIAASIA